MKAFYKDRDQSQSGGGSVRGRYSKSYLLLIFGEISLRDVLKEIGTWINILFLKNCVLNDKLMCRLFADCFVHAVSISVAEILRNCPQVNFPRRKVTIV